METKIVSLIGKLATHGQMYDAAQTVFESVSEGNYLTAMKQADYLSSLGDKLDESSVEYKIIQAIDAWVIDKRFEIDFRTSEKLDEVLIKLN